MPRILRPLLLATAITAAPLAAAAAEPPVPTLSVQAIGTVEAAPDTAVVTVGVMSQSKTAGPALTENNARMRKLMEDLRGAGIEARDLATSGFTIEPVVVYPPPAADGSQEPPRVTGYRVDNRVTVRIRDIGATGDLLDRVVRIGANQVQGIAFTVEDDEALLAEARTRAMRAAEAKARTYAEAGGFTLRRLLLVKEQVGGPIVFPNARMQEMSADSVPVAPGEQELSVTVEVNWEITQPN
jgi:uncharacterized protein YggE